MRRESQQSGSQQRPPDSQILRRVSWLNPVYGAFDSEREDGEKHKPSFLRIFGLMALAACWYRPFTTLETLAPFLVPDFSPREQRVLTPNQKIKVYSDRQAELARRLWTVDPEGLAYTMMGYYREFGDFFGKKIKTGIGPELRIAIWTSYLMARRSGFGEKFEETLYRLLSDSVSGSEQKKRDAADALVYWLTMKNPKLALKAIAKFGSTKQRERIKTFLPKGQIESFDKAVTDYTTTDTDILALREKVSQYIEDLGLIELIIFHYLKNTKKPSMTQSNEKNNDNQHQLTIEQISQIGLVCPEAANLILFLGEDSIKDPDPKVLAKELLLPNVSDNSNSLNLAYAFLYDYLLSHPENWFQVLKELDGLLGQNDIYKGKRIIPGPVKDFLKMAAKHKDQETSQKAFGIMAKLINAMINEIFAKANLSTTINKNRFDFFSAAAGMIETIFRFLKDNPNIIPPSTKETLKEIAKNTIIVVYNFIKQLSRIPPTFNERFPYFSPENTPTVSEVALNFLLKINEQFIRYFGIDEASQITAKISLVKSDGSVGIIEVPLTGLSQEYSNRISELRKLESIIGGFSLAS